MFRFANFAGIVGAGDRQSKRIYRRISTEEVGDSSCSDSPCGDLTNVILSPMWNVHGLDSADSQDSTESSGVDDEAQVPQTAPSTPYDHVRQNIVASAAQTPRAADPDDEIDPELCDDDAYEFSLASPNNFANSALRFFFIASLPEAPHWQKPPYLPPMTRSAKPKTLVLDLDETLVHCCLEPIHDADHVFPLTVGGSTVMVSFPTHSCSC